MFIVLAWWLASLLEIAGQRQHVGAGAQVRHEGGLLTCGDRGNGRKEADSGKQAIRRSACGTCPRLLRFDHPSTRLRSASTRSSTTSRILLVAFHPSRRSALLGSPLE